MAPTRFFDLEFWLSHFAIAASWIIGDDPRKSFQKGSILKDVHGPIVLRSNEVSGPAFTVQGRNGGGPKKEIALTGDNRELGACVQ